MKKRIIPFISALLLALSFASCQADTTEIPDESETESVTETEKAAEKATEKATEKETEKATEKATEKETEKATEKATEKETEKATEKATEKETEKATEKATETETEFVFSVPATEAMSHMDVERWLCYEIVFESSKEYKKPVYDTSMDVIFKNNSTGETLTRPAFWNGGTEWVVRFAIPEDGEWTWVTTCSDPENTGLGGKWGTVTCTAYTGDLDIYKHGFLKVEDGKKYFVHDDGTPFFYLGDTHWNLALEEIDGYGGKGHGDLTEEKAKQLGITSQHKYIMDYRKEQGFTVIQSQPLGNYTGNAGNTWFADEKGSATIIRLGVNDEMLEKFKEYDKRFAYIAECGFVHANSQLVFPEELIEVVIGQRRFDWDNLEKLCRYWVARYGAYPVMWTTGQECDKAFSGWGGCTPENNPWVNVIDYVAKYDTYNHPSTCHQEHWGAARVENSTFNNKDSHEWFACQIGVFYPNSHTMIFDYFREFYLSPKPAVNYEGEYDCYAASTGDVRAQAWISYLSGLTGYGYGVQPIFSFFRARNSTQQGTFSDVFGEWNNEIDWYDGLTSEGGKQMGYLADFMQSIEWTKLVPAYMTPELFESRIRDYGGATIGNDMYIGYYFGSVVGLATLKGMDGCEYTIRRYNPRTGEMGEPETIHPDEKGEYFVRRKPTLEDWVFVVEKAD